MRTLVRSIPVLLGILGTTVLSTDVNDKKDKRLTADFYFQWEQASDPQIAADGSRIVYVRRRPDIMTDRRFSNMKRVPDEPHGIRHHPSHYIAKILFIQDWFEKHKRNEKTSSN